MEGGGRVISILDEEQTTPMNLQVGLINPNDKPEPDALSDHEEGCRESGSGLFTWVPIGTLGMLGVLMGCLGGCCNPKP